MKVILATLATAALLGGCASFHEKAQGAEYAKLQQVHEGQTKDEVRGLAGRPTTMGPNRSGGETWVYTVANENGRSEEYDVDFDTNGKVRRVNSRH